MANGKRDLGLEKRWRDLVGRQPPSGLSVRAFCAREQVTEASFYAWRREIAVRDREKPMADGCAAAFVPVVVSGAKAHEAGDCIIIELRGGRVLRLPAMMPTARVTELVQAVEAAS